MNVVRFGISVEKEVLNLLDSYMEYNQFPNRSQAVRHLIQSVEIKKKIELNEHVGGSITMVFDHHKRELLDKLTDIQHDYHHIILCTQHVHLNHSYCMEIVALRGKALELQQLAQKLTAVKGVEHAELSITRGFNTTSY
jgi:CopG family nickel-responsive transcriptional regulator